MPSSQIPVPHDAARAIALSHELDIYWVVGNLLALLIPAALLYRGIAVRLRGVTDIPVVVGGDDTTALGLGPTNRIILQQDLARKETAAQIRFTIAHELKHYLLGDNWKALAIAAGLFLAGFWLADRCGAWAIS